MSLVESVKMFILKYVVDPIARKRLLDAVQEAEKKLPLDAWEAMQLIEVIKGVAKSVAKSASEFDEPIENIIDFAMCVATACGRFEEIAGIFRLNRDHLSELLHDFAECIDTYLVTKEDLQRTVRQLYGEQ